MHRFRTAVIAASVTALALASFAVSASAGPGKATIGIVNGIPNQRVDICVNGKELRSAAKYGKAVAKVVQAGRKVVTIRKASPGVCKGAKIARKVENLPVGADRTLVITKKAPRWAKFNNAGLGSIWPKNGASPSAYVAWRHAADLGTVNIRYRIVQETVLPFTPLPSADDPWVKGDQFVSSATPVAGTTYVGIAAGRVGNPKNFVKSVLKQWKPGIRYEYYLLGTWVGNAKIIVWARPITQNVV